MNTLGWEGRKGGGFLRGKRGRGNGGGGRFQVEEERGSKGLTVAGVRIAVSSTFLTHTISLSHKSISHTQFFFYIYIVSEMARVNILQSRPFRMKKCGRKRI